MKKILITLTLLVVITNLAAQDYKFGKVSKQELEEKVYPQDSSVNAAYLLKKRKTTFKYVQNEGFNVVTTVHERVKIYNPEGFDWATVELDLQQSGTTEEDISSLKATTFTLEDGKVVKTNLSKKEVFKEESNKYWSVKKFTMPNIKSGCIVEWTYKKNSPFSSIDDVQIQHEIPVKKIDVIIETPEYYVFKKRSKGYINIAPKEVKGRGSLQIKSKERSGGNGTAVTKTTFSQSKIDYTTVKDSYQLENIPALIEEPYVDNIENYQAAMVYELSELHWPSEPIKYFSNTWADVTKTIYNDSDFANQIYKSNHYKDDLEVVLANATSNEEKIVAVFEFVKQKITWNNYNGITAFNGTRKAYKEGIGNASDINLNLVSMLNSAGLKANPVLISTRSNGIPLYPTISGFNFVIVGVELDSGLVLLDATDPNSTPNNLPLRDINWSGRLIREDGSSSKVNLTPSKSSGTMTNIFVTINEDGETEGMFREKYTNLSALNYRDDYGNVKNEDIRAKLERENKGIEIEDLKITNKKEIYKPLIESCKFYSESLLDIVGNKIYIKPLLFNSMAVNPFKLEKREYPIDFGSPILKINRIIINIPEGYKVVSLPEKNALGLPNNYGSYKFNISTDGKKIIVQSSLEINTAILPVQNYNEIKEFYNLIVKKNSELIVLEKGNSTP